jgi:hypothetical protein
VIEFLALVSTSNQCCRQRACWASVQQDAWRCVAIAWFHDEPDEAPRFGAVDVAFSG